MSVDLSSMTVAALTALAKARGVRGYSRKKKAELVAMLLSNAPVPVSKTKTEKAKSAPRRKNKVSAIVPSVEVDMVTENDANNLDIQILHYMEVNKHTSMNDHIAQVRSKFPKLADFTDEEIKELCDCNNSYSQSKRCKTGGDFEKFIGSKLHANNISFQTQVPINKDGIIVSKKKNNKVVDIVIGDPKVGDHISKYVVVSLKTSSRERCSEDDWTKVHKPKLYIYGTLTSDYPSPEKFEENESRKMLCVTPKKDDTRIFKLGFKHLIDLIRE